MNKTVIRSLIIIFIVLIIFALVWLVYDMIKEKPVDANNIDTNLLDENTGLDNVINDLFENVVSNEIDDNAMQNEIDVNEVNDKNTEKNEENDTEEPTTGSVTSREEKAIQLVKKAWGNSDGVYFSNMGIDNQGRYIVSVNTKNTAVLAWYIVDVDSGLVTKQ